MDASAESPHQRDDIIPNRTCVESKRLWCSTMPAHSVSQVLEDITSSWMTPVPPLDDENLLQEVLLRLHPKPSSLPRASLVCKSWRSILSDHQFLKRFRKHHGKPPLLGFFVWKPFKRNLVFTPVLESPDSIPSACFSMPESRSPGERWIFTGCRHGLAVLVHHPRHEIVVWHPLTDQQHRVTFPATMNYKRVEYTQASVLCADAEDGHVHGDCFLSPFKLVLICIGINREAFVSLYESASGVWGNVVSTATSMVFMRRPEILVRPSILVRNALFWSTSTSDILVYDIERQTLGMVEKPADNIVTDYWCFQLLRMADGGLGLAVLSKLTVQLWERKSDFDGVVGWVLLQKTILLEGMLPWAMHSGNKAVYFVGYDEDTNGIFLTTMSGNFMLHLDSMEIRHIIKGERICDDNFYPYRNFYSAGRRVEWKWLDLEL